MVRLLRYVLENEDRMSPSRSRAIDWVRATYSRVGNPDPEITEALANVLRNDQHQGVRIKAADTLQSMQSAMTDNTRDALVEALKNDPNPAVRVKAVEALAKLARSGAPFDPETSPPDEKKRLGRTETFMSVRLLDRKARRCARASQVLPPLLTRTAGLGSFLSASTRASRVLSVIADCIDCSVSAALIRTPWCWSLRSTFCQRLGDLRIRIADA